MSDLIDRQALLKQIDIDSDGEPGYYGDTWKFIDTIKSMPPTELSTNLASLGTDAISRQAAISAICNACGKIDCDKMDKCEKLQLPPANCSEFPNNSDTISRQAAIDAVRMVIGDNRSISVCDAIKQLPPIHPVNNSEMPNSSDVISRQKAIDALRAMQTYKLFAGDDMLLIDQAGAQTELMLLPPIQPKRGRWHYSDGKPATIGLSFGVICDQCGIESEYCTNFCGECGADMRATK